VTGSAGRLTCPSQPADRCASLGRALETVTIDDIKGPVAMRKCDHQAVQNGFMVRAVKREDFSHSVPEIIATYPGEETTPPCNKETFEE
jgi:hypothetical protein